MAVPPAAVRFSKNLPMTAFPAMPDVKSEPPHFAPMISSCAYIGARGPASIFSSISPTSLQPSAMPASVPPTFCR